MTKCAMGRWGRAAGVAVVGLAGLAGCADYSHQLASEVRGDPTPELQTLWERPVDVKNHMAITRNTNARSGWEDLGRVFLMDHPSRLVVEPMPR